MQPAPHDRFTDNFRAMWEHDSQVHTIWGLVENCYQALVKECATLGLNQAQARSIHEIDRDMQEGKKPMDVLGPECMALLWDRIVLRTHLKVRDAMRMLFYSTNTANAYGCALSARCIMEHVALLQYFVDRVPWRDTRRVPMKGLVEFTKNLMVLAQGSKVDWDALMAGGLRETVATGKWKRTMETGLPPVGQLLNALDSALFQKGRLNAEGEIKFLYGVLCDVVHPNWGGDFIYTPHMYHNLGCEPTFDDHFKLCAVFFCPCTAELLAHLLSTAKDLEGDKLIALWKESATRS